MYPVFVIFVALDGEKFDHYCRIPQIYYETKNEAEKQMKQMIADKVLPKAKLKIQKLWLVQKINKNEK